MNSFQAKIGWKQMRKREIKIIVPFRSVPTRCVIENSKKNSKKIQKIKFILPFHSCPRRDRKFQKNGKKIKKYHCGFISSQNRLEKAGKERQ